MIIIKEDIGNGKYITPYCVNHPTAAGGSGCHCAYSYCVVPIPFNKKHSYLTLMFIPYVCESGLLRFFYEEYMRQIEIQIWNESDQSYDYLFSIEETIFPSQVSMLDFLIDQANRAHKLLAFK